MPERGKGVSFTDGKPFTVTEEDIHKPWSGGANGKYFRCGLCGHKFVSGETARWQFTNNIPGAGGNPLVCSACDTPDVIEKWKQMHVDAKTKFWWFTNRNNE
jgi:hypothetical protein